MHDYESPIRIIQGKMEEEIVDNIYKVVQSYDIEVDKEELLKALRYDREQYDKGYAIGYADGFGDGISNAKRPKWISVEDRLPKDGVRVLALHEDGIVRIGSSQGYFPAIVSRTYTKTFGIVEVTHWMPLPEPPNCGADMRGNT